MAGVGGMPALGCPGPCSSPRREASAGSGAEGQGPAVAIPLGRGVPAVTAWASLQCLWSETSPHQSGLQSQLAALTEPFTVVLLPLQEQKDEPRGYTDHL